MTDDAEPRQFRPLGTYRWPALPADETVKRWWTLLRDVFRKAPEDEPFVADSALDRLGTRMLDRIAPPPACGPLMEELTASLADWLDRPASGDRLRLIVMQPCDEADTLKVWAEDRGLTVLAPPDRDADIPVNILAGTAKEDGVLVIPALERWFLRHADGLGAVRGLLDAISKSDRPCLVGCNSWAWTYLSKSCAAQSFLPQGLTFQAFDGDALQDWFRRLSTDEGSIPARFRVSSTGTDLFDADTERSDYFTRLAALSLGIPWVAWRMWRDAMRDLPDPELDETDVPEGASEKDPAPRTEKTFWLTEPDTFTLPVSAGEMTLLTLQTLLIHGPMTAEDLFRTLPAVEDRHTVAALLKAGMLKQDGERVACNPAAYPAIRAALSDAGFNMDDP